MKLRNKSFHDKLELPPTPLWFKIMMGVGMAFSLAILGVIVWGIITLVNWVAAK